MILQTIVLEQNRSSFLAGASWLCTQADEAAPYPIGLRCRVFEGAILWQ
jgi:hypothetical protein